MGKPSRLLLIFILLFSYANFIFPMTIKKQENEPVKGIFLTIWTMTSKKKLKKLINLVEQTELNTLIIDVKSNGGNLIFDWVKDLDLFIKEMHQKKIYLIGRISVFKDSKLVSKKPFLALKNKNGGYWKDSVNGKWVDPAARESWAYNVDIAKKAIKIGFDEINFDYIRFPSEGDLDKIIYPIWDGNTDMSLIIRGFYKYLKHNLQSFNKPLSIDLFAYGILSHDDLGIGQRFIDCFDYFDYICPMLYPSHYSSGNFGFDNPAEHPYDVIYQTLIRAKIILLANKSGAEIRPWLQSFNLGAKYTERMIILEKKAVYDALGIDAGWLLWNPGNIYKKAALNSLTK